MTCAHSAPDGNPSLLARQLLDKYQDSELVDKVMFYISSDNFILDHGDYKKDQLLSNEHLLLNEQGEPSIEWVENNLQPYIKVAQGQTIPTSKGFQGYKGGFENKGKGTPEGDGKDKAMRSIATTSIVELASQKKESSSKTTQDKLPWDSNKSIDGIVMLARNRSLKGKELDPTTKKRISEAKERGAEFIVGDMPNVDSQFVDYLKEISAPYTIYHTGNSPRFQGGNTELDLSKPNKDEFHAFEYANKDNPVELRLTESNSKEQLSQDELKTRIRTQIFDKANASLETLHTLGYTNISSRFKNKLGVGVRDIASAFDDMREEVPPNLQIPATFNGAMEHARSLKLLESHIPDQQLREPVEHDRTALNYQLASMRVPVVDERGNTVDLFDEQHQADAMNASMRLIYNAAIANPDTPAYTVMAGGLWKLQQFELAAKKQGLDDLANKYNAIVKSFSFNDDRPSFANLILDSFDQRGLKLDPKVREKILKNLDQQKSVYKAPLTEEQLAGTQENRTTEHIDQNNAQAKPSDLGSLSKDGEAGRGVENWAQTAFEIDMRDTASTRMKFYMSSIDESENGIYERAIEKEGALDLSHRKSADELTISDALKANNNRIWHDNPKTLDNIMAKLETNFDVIPFRGNLGVNELADMDTIFEDTMATLAGQADQSIDNYLRLMRASGNPNMKALANKLDGIAYSGTTQPDEQVRNEFVKVASKQYAGWSLTRTQSKQGSNGQPYTEVRIMSSQRSSRVQTIVHSWQEGFKLSPMTIIRENGERTMDSSKARKEHVPVIQAYNLVYNELPKSTDRKATIDKISKLLPTIDFKQSAEEFIKDAEGNRQFMQRKMSQVLADYGLALNTDMQKALFGTFLKARKGSAGNTIYDPTDQVAKYTKGTKYDGDIARQFQLTKDGLPNGMFSVFVYKAAGLKSDSDLGDDTDSDVEKQVTLNNPLFTESTTMRTLAQIASKFTPVVHTSTHKSVENKIISDYTNNTSLSKLVQGMKEDFPYFSEDLLATDIISPDRTKANGSFYLRQWMAKPELRDKFQLNYLDGLVSGFSKGITRSSMSDAEQLLTSILNFQNGDRPTGHFISLTHSDKTMTPLFQDVPKLDIGTSTLNPEVLKEFDQLFLGEHRRISAQANTEFNDSKYNEGKKYFFFMPQFNKEVLESRVGETVKGIKITPEQIQTLWFDDGTINPNPTASRQLRQALLLEHIEQRSENAYQYWEDNGIESSMLDRKVVRKYEDAAANSDNKEETMLRAMSRDYGVNHWLWNSNMSLLFYGDPAQAWKPSKGGSVQDSIDSTMKEYSKRLAKDIAPGTDLSFPKGSTYQALTINDVNPAETYITKWGIKLNAQGTDAQEFTTTKEHLDVMYSEGLIPEKQYQKLLEVIRDGNKSNKWEGMDKDYYEFDQPDLDIVLQPRKPLYAGFRPADQGARLYDYVKSSSYPLLPELTHGMEIDNVRKLMEGHKDNMGNPSPIARANFVTAKKIGSPTEAATLFTKDGTFVEDPNYPQAVQTLQRQNLRIQQDVPYDEYHDYIKVLTQMNKSITTNLPETTFHLRDGREMSREQIRDRKEEVYSQMIHDSVQKLVSRVSNDKGEISLPGLANILQDEAKANPDRYSQNDLYMLSAMKADGSYQLSPFLHPNAEKYEALLMSLISKTTDIMVPGRSYVQASSIGYVRNNIKTQDKVGDKSKIVYVGDFRPDQQLRHQQKMEDGTIKPAQIFIPFDFTLANGKKADLSDYTIEHEDGHLVLDTTKIPKELLEMIGGRVPNQGHNSMIAADIAGFTPKAMGDQIIVPSTITGQMGSDFDVDKLYTYRRPYTHDATTNTFSMDKEALTNEYFDIHRSVLLNSDMYDKVLNPLDKPDLDDLNKKYQVEQKKGYSYYDASSQLQDFQNGKDAKTLVALTSLSTTFNSVLQNKEVRAGHYDFGEDGKPLAKPDSITVHYNGEKLELSYFSGYGQNTYKRGNDELVRSKHDNHTTIQSGAVDNAKNRTLDNLNISLATYPAMDALHQLQTEDRNGKPGKTVGTDFSVALMVQESMWNFSKGMRKGNDSLSDEYEPDLAKATTTKLIADLQKQYYGEEGFSLEKLSALYKKVNEYEISPEKMTRDWKQWQKGQTDSEDYIVGQIAYLKMFDTLLGYGERLSQLRKTINQDTNGAGPNILYALNQMDNYNNLTTKESFKVMLGEDTITKGEQGNIFKDIIPTSITMGQQIYPVAALQTGIAQVLRATGKTLRDVPLDTQREIIRSVKSFMVTQSTTFGNDPEAERYRLLSGGGGQESLAIRLERTKQEYPNNFLLQRLQTNISMTGKGPDTITYENGKTMMLDEERTMSSFIDLLNSPDKQLHLLGEDLVRYAYLLHAANGPSSFLTKIPSSYLLATPFADDMNRMLEDDTQSFNPDDSTASGLNNIVGSDIFRTQLFQHMPELAPKAVAEDFGNYSVTGQDFPELFMTRDEKFSIPTDDNNLTPVPFISYYSKTTGKQILYKLRGQGDSSAYQRIDTLGKGDMTEYNALAEGNTRSIFPDNMALKPFSDSNSVHQWMNDQVNRMIRLSDNKDIATANWELPVDRIGKMTDMNRTLDNMANDVQLPEYLRTVAKVLGESSQTHEELNALEALGIGLRSFSVKLDPTMKERGTYTPATGELRLKPTGDKVQAAEALLHEMSHQRTSAIAYALGYATDDVNTKMAEQGIQEEYNQRVDTFRSKNKELADKMHRLDEIRYTALDRFQRQLIESGLDPAQLSQDIRDNRANTKEHQLLYGLSNLQEFIAHAYTNKEVMQYLNEIPAEGNKTFVNKVWDMLSSIFESIGKFIGMDVKDGSLLHEAYALTLHLNNLQATDHLGLTIKDGAYEPQTLIMHTESEANQLASILENSSGQKVEKSSDLSKHFLTITDKQPDRSSQVSMPETTRKLLSKLQTQSRDLNKMISNTDNSEEGKARRVELTKVSAELRKDIEDVMQHRDLYQMADIGDKQLDWVEGILRNPKKPSIHEASLALSLLGTWTDLNNLIYDGSLSDVNQKFADRVASIQGKAANLNSQWLNYAARAAVDYGKTQQGFSSTTEDFKSLLHSPDFASMYTITPTRYIDKAMQIFASATHGKSNLIDEDTLNLRNTLNDIEKKIPRGDTRWTKFMHTREDGTQGLVQPLTPEWFKESGSAITLLNRKVFGINTKNIRGSIEAKAAKKEAFKDFWEKTAQFSTPIDIRYLVDFTNGKRLNTPESEKEYKRLVEVTGKKDLVDAAIDRSLTKYNEYLDHKRAMIEDTSKVQLSDDEATEFTTPEDKKSGLEAKQDRFRNAWIHRNSPTSFLDTSRSNAPDSQFEHNVEDSWSVPEFLPKSGSKMFDTNYEDIKKDPTMSGIYDQLMAMSRLYRSYLPQHEQKRLDDTFLPIASIKDIETMYNQVSKMSISKFGQKAFEALTVSQYEKDRMNKDEIPLRFLKKEGQDQKLSADIPKLMEMFGNMAIHYHHMAPIEQMIGVFQSLIKGEAVKRIAEGKNEDDLGNMSESLKFFKDMLVYKKPKKLEAISDTPIYDANLITNKKLEKEVVDIRKRMDTMSEEAMMSDSFGTDLQRSEEDIAAGKEATPYEKLQDRLKEIESNARYLAGSKATDTLISVNQLKSIAFSPFSAVNNLTFGVISAFMHAYGRVDYAPSDLRWGFKQMMGSVGRSLSFHSTSPGDSLKIRNIMDRIGVVSEVLETMYGKSHLDSMEKSMLRKITDGYAWQKNGDYLHKGAMVLAMMRNTKVSVEINGQKTDIPLYEAFNEKGQWDSIKYGENKKWSSENVTEQTEWNKFRDKSKKVAMIVHGNQDKNAPLLAKSKMLGRLMGNFRMSWLPEGIYSRFGKEYPDLQLGRNVKGRYRTLYDLGAMESIKTLFSQLGSMFTKSDPFTGKILRNGNEMSATDKENMRKNMSELGYITLFASALALCKAIGPSAEEKRKLKAAGKMPVNYNMLAFNMLMRSYQDVTLYSSPSIFDQVTGNVVPATSVLTDTFKALQAVGYLPFNKDPHATRKTVMKVTKAIPYADLYNKYDFMVNRDISATQR